MPVSSDIVATYKGPGAVYRRLLEPGRDEMRALSFCIFGALMLFVAQTPWQARAAHFDPSGPLEVRLYWSGLLFLLVLPLLLYCLSFLLWALSRVVAPTLSGFAIRMSLFWAVLAATPIALLAGILAGFQGEFVGVQAIGLLWVFVVLWFFISGLRSYVKIGIEMSA